MKLFCVGLLVPVVTMWVSHEVAYAGDPVRCGSKVVVAKAALGQTATRAPSASIATKKCVCLGGKRCGKACCTLVKAARAGKSLSSVPLMLVGQPPVLAMAPEAEPIRIVL